MEKDTMGAMSQSLNRLEARLQRLIEEGTARLFASQDTRGLLAARLIEAMQAEVTFGEGDQLLAPSIYTIHSNSEHAAALKNNKTLLTELSTALKQAASESGVQLTGEPVLHIAPEDNIAGGEFRVRCAGMGESLTQTQALRTSTQTIAHQIPLGAFLIVGGAEIFTLNLPIVNIGRKSDNHLVIDNPQISRRHAQLRAISDHYHFFDLGSTGGSQVNGVDVKSVSLSTGDVINLAGTVPLIYSQDEIHSISQTQEYKPGENGKHPVS
ncbi:MAG: FhaA domain-containing protein [Anaerolineales bacterium]